MKNPTKALADNALTRGSRTNNASPASTQSSVDAATCARANRGRGALNAQPRIVIVRRKYVAQRRYPTTAPSITAPIRCQATGDRTPTTPRGLVPKASATPPTESTPSQNVLVVKATPCAISGAERPQPDQKRYRMDAPVIAENPTFMLNAYATKDAKSVR